MEVLPDTDRQKVLAEFLGYIFISIRRLKAEKALLLYGTGANGKSVVYEVIYSLLGGYENVTGYSFDTLTNVEKGGAQRAVIADKLLNYGSEISSRLDPNMVKAMISGEPVEARPLYQAPFMIEDYAKFIFNCNELPKDTEQTHAFFRRFLIIPFDITIPEERQDRQLPQRIIKTELSGIFNWVMQGLNRLLEHNAFTDCEAVRKQLDRYRQESDSVQMFLEDRGYVPSPEYSLLLKEVYIDYRSFCLEDGFKPVNKTNFKKRLEGIGILVEGRKNRIYLKQESNHF